MLEIQEHVLLAPFTTFGIGGPADFFVVVTSTDEIQEAVQWAKEKHVPFFFLGKGANILIGDKGYRGLVIKNESSEFHVADLLLTANSGADVQEIIAYTAEKGFSGFEHFAGIPSTVGGALWQNLHFLSPDRSKTVYISEIVESADILKTQDTNESAVQSVVQVTPDYFHFDYDYSSLHDNKDIVVAATFRLTPAPKDEIKKTIASNLEWRKQKHPDKAVSSSAGSVFKKIEGHGAGRLIEQVGLKGHVLGGAQISEKHANFIINIGGATAQNVRDLIRLVQTKVKEKSGLDMTPEIRFVGEF